MFGLIYRAAINIIPILLEGFSGNLRGESNLKTTIASHSLVATGIHHSFVKKRLLLTFA
jgi:hypothetical protein